MKKILSLVLTVFILLSCNNNNDDKVILDKKEYEKLIGGSTGVKTITINNTRYIIYTGSDGHEYYKYRTYKYDNYAHWVDCEKCLNRNQKDSL